MKNSIFKTIAFVAIISFFVACEKQPSPTPTNPGGVAAPPVPAALCTIQVNADSVITCDSVYWKYASSGCATVYGFAAGNRTIEVFLAACGSEPITTGSYPMDEIGGSPRYWHGQNLYGINGSQSMNIQALPGNMVSGNFEYDMRGSSVVFGSPNVYTPIANIRLKVNYENVPFHS
ncbi:MAG: hypothetical protein Q8M29_11275 [Bacteroidota bacterium]|nr:hypothetical protein [Bacteroidota bacterium]